MQRHKQVKAKMLNNWFKSTLDALKLQANPSKLTPPALPEALSKLGILGNASPAERIMAGDHESLPKATRMPKATLKSASKGVSWDCPKQNQVTWSPGARVLTLLHQ